MLWDLRTCLVWGVVVDGRLDGWVDACMHLLCAAQEGGKEEEEEGGDYDHGDS